MPVFGASLEETQRARRWHRSVRAPRADFFAMRRRDRNGDSIAAKKSTLLSGDTCDRRRARPRSGSVQGWGPIPERRLGIGGAAWVASNPSRRRASLSERPDMAEPQSGTADGEAIKTPRVSRPRREGVASGAVAFAIFWGIFGVALLLRLSPRSTTSSSGSTNS